MFDKKNKEVVKRIYLVNDDGFYDRKGFHKIKTIFIPFIEIALLHGCSPVNLMHIFGTPYSLTCLVPSIYLSFFQ